DIVAERAILRTLIEAGTDIANSAFQTEGRDVKEILDVAESQIFKIAEQRDHGTGPVAIADLLSLATDKIDTLYRSGKAITGLATGFNDFDKMTSGLQAGDLVIVAGRPSMGKTVLGMNIAEHAAIKEEKPVLVFSLEMPSEAIALRLMSSLGRIDQHRIRTGRLNDDDWPRVTSAVSMLSEANMYIDDTPALSPNEVRSRARRLAREHGGLSLIVIDYLQLMQVPGAKENRATEVSEISRSLKAIAKELNVPVIALSQLNRSLESRTDRRPVMSDLRESGSLEQDADVIVFIYRDEVYHEDSPDKGIAEIIIRKHRNGPIGDFRLTFLGKYTRFENYMPAASPQMMSSSPVSSGDFV
ncbi:MAG: replicative DNA helicase, partial [Coxiellaceae bacterium]|nr:replicative DNA helicase [Coxiellaceae bacterium]